MPALFTACTVKLCGPSGKTAVLNVAEKFGGKSVALTMLSARKLIFAIPEIESVADAEIGICPLSTWFAVMPVNVATLGGAGLMPGFRSGRLRDRSAAVATLRYSWPIWMWLKGSIQTAAGNVFSEHLQDFRPELFRMSAAIGIESEGSPDSTLQVLFGVGTETFEQGAHVDSLRLTDATSKD